jgi:hypothetical protein
MNNVLSSKTLPKQPQIHVKRRREERKIKRMKDLLFLLLKGHFVQCFQQEIKALSCHGSQDSRVDERREKSKRQVRKWWRFSWLRGGSVLPCVCVFGEQNKIKDEDEECVVVR